MSVGEAGSGATGWYQGVDSLRFHSHSRSIGPCHWPAHVAATKITFYQRLALATFLWIAALAVLQPTQLLAQTPSATPTFRVESSLTLVDVIAENKVKGIRSRESLPNLRREDFRILDNGREMNIESLDIGAEHATRPIALWLIVECNQGERPGYHSMFMRGQTHLLEAALQLLAPNDVIGVAHWCDDGSANLDILPAADAGTALAKVEQILSEKPTRGTNRTGELTMQRMVRLVLENTHETKPQRLPIFLFLYGDHCATHADEANSLDTDLLENAGIVYGINDGTWPFDPDKMTSVTGEVFYLVHYYSRETGGEVYSSVDSKLFSTNLDHILTQVHLRYTIGFKPLKLDGKRHSLTVELTPAVRKKFPGAELRFRSEYIPLANR